MKSLSVMMVTAAFAISGCATLVPDTPVTAIAGALSPAPGVVSAGRLNADDIARARAAGIRQIIDLTPDAETPGFDEAAAVRTEGLSYANLPLRGAGDLTLRNVEAFDALLRTAKRPVLVHCASGNRVGAMAALRAAWIDGRTDDDAISIGRSWGLKGLEDEVRRRIKTGP